MIAERYFEPYSCITAEMSYRCEGGAHIITLAVLAYEAEPESWKFSDIADARIAWRKCRDDLIRAGFRKSSSPAPVALAVA